MVSPYYWVGAGVFILVAIMILFCIAVFRRMNNLMEQEREEQSTFSSNRNMIPHSPHSVSIQSEELPSEPPPYKCHHIQDLQMKAGFQPLPNL